MSGELQVGEVVAGRFLLDQKLGSGAFGSVWRALDREQGYTMVALKMLHEHLASEPRVKERFAREARVLTELDHPAVARAIAWSDSGELQYLAMEYVQGPTLRTELSRRTLEGEKYTFNEVCEMSQTIASALAAAHARGIVHRDLKPQNLVLSRAGVKVLDFGIARIADVKPEDETTIGRMLGSWQYMPPEQVRGERVDERSDLFSLGAIMFELLTLRRAFARTDSGEPMPALDVPLDSSGVNSRYNLLRRIVVEPRERPSRWRPDVTSAVDALVLRALESERENRFASAEVMYEAIVDAFGRESGVRMRGTALVRARAETAVPADIASMEDAEKVTWPPEAERAIAEPSIVLDKTAALPIQDKTAAVQVHDRTAAVQVHDRTTALRPSIVDRTTLIAPEDRASLTRTLTNPSPLPAVTSPQRKMVLLVLLLAGVLIGLAILQIAIRPDETPVLIEAVAPPVAEPQPQPQPEVQARPSVATNEPVREPVREAKTKRTAPVVRPEVVPAPPLSEIEKMLASAKKDPENAQRIQELGAKIREEARALADPKLRTSIERCAITSAVKGDLDALGACAERLLAAQREPR